MDPWARLLIVDDEDFDVLFLQRGLGKLPDCQVDTASSGEQALQLFEKGPFDVLITDYNMPGMDGLMLAARVKQLYPQTAIIMVSGSVDHVLNQLPEGAFIQGILAKPVEPGEIRNLIFKVLEPCRF